MMVFLLLLLLLTQETAVFAQWSQVTGFPSAYTYDLIYSGGILYACTGGNGVYKSTDGGISWQNISNGLISQQSKDTHQIMNWGGSLYTATTDGIYKSTDGGNNWIKKSNGIIIGPGALYEFTESIFQYNGKLFTGAWNGIYVSTDEAENWTITNVSGEGIGAKNFTEHNGILFAARESINNPIGYKSLDSGITWQDLTGLSYLNTITFYSDPPELWAGAVGGPWVSFDNGNVWELRAGGLSADPYTSSIIRVNGLLLSGDEFDGVSISNDEGINWVSFSEGLSTYGSNKIFKLITYDGVILAATGDGIWQRDESQVPVELVSLNASANENDVTIKWETATEKNNKGFGIERKVQGSTEWENIGFVEGNGTSAEKHSYSYKDKDLNPGSYTYRLRQTDFNGDYSFSRSVEVIIGQPSGFQLSQNYPNPFNPSTRISFDLPNPSFVSLVVYDILGNKTAVLVNEQKPAGSYSVNFNAEGLSSGIYYYTIKAGSFSLTRKMVYVK